VWRLFVLLQKIPELWFLRPLVMRMKSYYRLNRNRLWPLGPTLIVLGTLAISVQSAQDQHGYTVIEFNVPGFQDTFPEDNNPAGAIVGKARDASGEGPAFVRAPDGTVTTFEASNAASLTAA